MTSHLEMIVMYHDAARDRFEAVARTARGLPETKPFQAAQWVENWADKLTEAATLADLWETLRHKVETQQDMNISVLALTEQFRDAIRDKMVENRYAIASTNLFAVAKGSADQHAASRFLMELDGVIKTMRRTR